MNVYGYIRVCRPPLLFLGVIASLGLLSWSGNLFSSPVQSLLIVATVATGNLGWTLQNEIWDEDVDAIKKPSKPLPSGEVTFDNVASLSFFMFLASIFCNLALSVLFGAVYLWGYLAHFTSFVYNHLRKDLVGNISMAVSYGLAAFISLFPHHLLFCVPWSLLTVAHNLNNQHQDLEADRQAGSYTVPQQIGRISTFILTIFLLAMSLLFFVYLYFETDYKPLLVFITVCLTLMFTTFAMTSYMSKEAGWSIVEYVTRGLGRVLLIIGFLAMIFF